MRRTPLNRSASLVSKKGLRACSCRCHQGKIKHCAPCRCFKPRKPIPVKSVRPLLQHSRTSKKGRESQKRSAFVKQILERSNGKCEVCLLIWLVDPYQAAKCLGKATEVHEPLTRGRGGRTDDPDNALASCRRGHFWTHENPLAAKRVGLLRSASS